ncbi:hypothetical protein MMC16_006105 [Acarospora aff. strigata]|nr:hypothetical protein [Acarospora aff. strigata]
MSRIQIPLEALTSRLGLQGRFDGVRSQSITSRFANLKPISEFLDLKRLSKPANFSEVQTRVNYNLAYFSSNYLVVFIMLSIYSLLTNYLLLFVIVLVVGGMYGIGKLKGQDLELGAARATTSQLYTGLLVIAVPLGMWASPISTVLWLIGATGTNRECFFRGGGLGGRPRTPHDLPQRGRPSRGQHERRRREGARDAGQWEQYDRFEEVESDRDDSGQYVDFRPHMQTGQFVSDALRFTGTDLGFSSRHTKRYEYVDDSDFSNDDLDDPSDLQGGAGLQVVMRDKEDLLVQKAMERIRRAQMLGKTRVKLTQPELDALERKRLRATAAENLKDEQFASSGSGNDSAHNRRSGRSGRAFDGRTTSLPEPSRRKSRTSFLRHDKRSPQPSTEMVSTGFLVSGRDGVPVYGPPSSRESLAALPSGSSSRLASRSGLDHDNQHYHRTTSAPQYQHAHPQQHYSTIPEGTHPAVRPPSSSPRGSPRPLPDDPAWMPRVRSASSVQAHAVDPFQYQTYAPPTLQVATPYPRERRIVSGPPDIQYSSIRRAPASPYAVNARMGSSSSDSSLSRLQPLPGHAEELLAEGDDDYEDVGNDQDLQYDEMPARRSYFSRFASADIAGGRQRRGRR